MTREDKDFLVNLIEAEWQEAANNYYKAQDVCHCAWDGTSPRDFNAEFREVDRTFTEMDRLRRILDELRKAFYETD